MIRTINLFLFLTLTLSAYSQSAEQVVRSYISTLNDALSSPDDMTRRGKVERMLESGGVSIKDQVVEKYNTQSTSRMLAGQYIAIFYDEINKSSTKWIKATIIGSPSVKEDRGIQKVYVKLQYSGAISLRTASEFWVKQGKITGIVSDELGIAEISSNTSNSPDLSRPLSAPFTITDCAVGNWSLDAKTQYMPFNSGNTHVLWAYTTFSVQQAGSYKILCKFITPNNTYTDTKTVELTSGEQKKYVFGFGNDIPGNHPAGSYRYEFYYNGNLLYTHRFTVPVGQQSAPISGGSSSNHEYVDLGLPSGTLWATCNVGASSPEDYGSYFAWGETKPKSDYDMLTYEFGVNPTKYNNSDGKKTLDYSNDAAYQNWGSDWCMPTIDQLIELIEKCRWQWTTHNGKNGLLVTSKKNGNTLFLPAAGYRSGTSLDDVGSGGNYWSRSLDESDPHYARGIDFNSGVVGGNRYRRYYGRSVRPVRRR